MLKIDFEHLRFLVVDDNAYMRQIVRTLLHGLGVRDVNEAEDGADGLAQFETCEPDIVITDWVMPMLDGLELIRALRNPAHSKNAYVPIILLTAYADRKRVFAARDAGITEILCKPLSAKALHDRIANIVLNPRPFVRTSSFFGPDRRRFQHPGFTDEERRGAKLETPA
jgi:CheY-like chemotaxis protein